MSDFAGRLGKALPHEQVVAGAIRDLGCWTVVPFADGMISPKIRETLRVWPAALRWMPDLLAVRRHEWCVDPLPAPDAVRLIDVKAGRTDTANYDLEARALLSYLRWEVFDVSVWLVFHDLQCARADDISRAALRPLPQYGNGSGTPGWLLRKDDPCVVTLIDAFGNWG